MEVGRYLFVSNHGVVLPDLHTARVGTRHQQVTGLGEAQGSERPCLVGRTLCRGGRKNRTGKYVEDVENKTKH